MESILVVEGQPIHVDQDRALAIRQRLRALEEELQPRVSFVGGTDAIPVIWNLVGTVQITTTLLLDVQPKTEPGAKWTRAVVELLRSERVSLAGEVSDATWRPQSPLPDAIAEMYARQLDRAIRREGPLTLLEQRRVNQARLSGHLNVTRWLTYRTTTPHQFPQTITELSADNRFTAAMAWAAEALASRTSELGVRASLRESARRLRPGLADYVTPAPGVEFMSIPPQWSTFGPAWTIACSVIRQISPLHRSGSLHGFGLAIEAWPLLETLLARAVQSAAELGREMGLDLTAPTVKPTFPLLEPQSRNPSNVLDDIHTLRRVEPDAALYLDGRPIVAFEAKYNVPTTESTRRHFFQALPTAAAMDAPLSVVVYPELAEPVTWRVGGFGGAPRTLVAVGLDMFEYVQGSGDRERGRALLDLITSQLGERLTAVRQQQPVSS